MNESLNAAVDLEIEPERYELFENRDYRFDLDRRGFLKSLGGGILVLHLLNTAHAEQQPGGRRRGGGGQQAPREIAAWLHIGEDGKISVYTGKAEVGQNIRTSLTQVVAEELHALPQSIRLVMADTQLTPYDAGTFGSRTTPDMSHRLRRTAAAAREMLIDLAANSWKADRALLKAASGTIVHSGTGQKLEFGKLTKGQKLTKSVADDMAPTPPTNWTVAGASQPKIDGRSFVTGGHEYTSDLKLPGMLVGKILRPPSLGATLSSVELNEAQAVPGAVVVHDGEFVGVAAPSSLLASRALAAIKAQWNPGPRLSGKDLYDNLKLQGAGRAAVAKTTATQAARSRRTRNPQTSSSSRHIRLPISLMRRSSPARPLPGGKTENSPSGPGLNVLSACAMSSRGLSVFPTMRFELLCPTPAPAMAASTPGRQPSRRLAWRVTPASR